MQPKRVIVTTLLVLATLFGAYLIWQLGGVVMTAYTAFIIAAALGVGGWWWFEQQFTALGYV